MDFDLISTDMKFECNRKLPILISNKFAQMFQSLRSFEQVYLIESISTYFHMENGTSPFERVG